MNPLKDMSVTVIARTDAVPPLIGDLVVGMIWNSSNNADPHRVRSDRGGIFNIPGPPQG